MNCQEAKIWMENSSDDLTSPEFQAHIARCSRCGMLYQLIQIREGDFKSNIPALSKDFGVMLAQQIIKKVPVADKKYKVFSLRWISVAAAAIVMGVIIGKVLNNNSNATLPESVPVVAAGNSENEGYNDYIPAETAYTEYFNAHEK